MSGSLVVRARRVVLPGGEQPAAVHVEDGVITAVTGFDDGGAAAVTLAPAPVQRPCGRHHPGGTACGTEAEVLRFIT